MLVRRWEGNGNQRRGRQIPWLRMLTTFNCSCNTWWKKWFHQPSPNFNGTTWHWTSDPIRANSSGWRTADGGLGGWWFLESPLKTAKSSKETERSLRNADARLSGWVTVRCLPESCDMSHNEVIKRENIWGHQSSLWQCINISHCVKVANMPELKGSVCLQQHRKNVFFQTNWMSRLHHSFTSCPTSFYGSKIKKCHVRQGEMLLFDRTINECIQFSYQTGTYEVTSNKYLSTFCSKGIKCKSLSFKKKKEKRKRAR